MTNLTKSIIIASVAFLPVATPALAHSDGLPRIEINAGGYDLTSGEGVSALTSKVRSAARSACHVNEDSDLGVQMAANACYKRAVADAGQRIAVLRQQRLASRQGEQVTVSVASADTNRPGK